MSNVSGRSWPTKRLPDQFGAPSNAAVGSVPDLPKPRNSAAATQAMDILADAVWRIDARDHQNAGAPLKVVRNLGTGGSVLDCRTGSTSVPDTNDPLFLPAEQRAYVHFPGVNGNYLSVPNETALNLTNDMEFVIRFMPLTQTGAFISKAASAGDVNSNFSLYWNVGAVIRLQLGNGTTSVGTQINGTSFTIGSVHWMKVTLGTADGSGNRTMTLYRADDQVTEPSSWTTIGSSTLSAIGTPATNSNSVFIGSIAGGTVNTANFYRAIVRNAIGGTTVLDVDTSVLTTGSATSFTAATGQTVTINRSTSGRKTVVVPSADVKKVDDANVYLPGVIGNDTSIPHVAGQQAGDVMDIRVDLAPDSYASTAVFAGKATSIVPGAGSWTFGIVGTTGIRFVIVDGTSGTVGVQTSSFPVPAGTRVRYRVAYTRNTGSGQYAVDFYYSQNFSTAISTDTSWTQIGTTFTGASIGATYDAAVAMFVGAYRTSTAGLPGKYYAASVAVNGTVTVNIDTSVAPTNFTPGYAAAFPAVTGQTVTMNSTAGSAMRVNGERFAAGSPVWLFGTDDYMEVPMSATGSKLLDFGPNDSFTAFVVFRAWGTVPSYNNNLLTKRNQRSSVAGAGWTLALQPAPSVLALWWDQYQRSFTAQTSAALGSAQVGVALRDRIRKVVQANSNTLSTTVSDITGDITSNLPVTIGRSALTTDYGDFEIIAAMVWRRALTAAEIQNLTTYYQSKVA